MNDVIEGAAINFDDQDEVRLSDCPFAYRLDRALRELGVSVQPFAPMLPGAPIRPDGFTQLHMKQNKPEALASVIRQRFGIGVQFAELAIPARGLQCVTWQKAGNVWIRHIVDYMIMDDSLHQRWDVLVKTK